MINHTYKFAFVKLSKSASTTITKALTRVCPNTSYEKTLPHHILDLTSDDSAAYYNFSTARNPYDRLVSRYFYARDKAPIHKSQFKNLTFKDFVVGGHESTPMNTSWVPKTAPHLKKLLNRVGFFDNQIEWIQDNQGKTMVNFIIKVENLQQDFNMVCDKIGIPHTKLPHKNRSNHKPYAEYYDDETRQIVSEKYARDIEYFGYEFGA
jgi:hypothetical protein